MVRSVFLFLHPCVAIQTTTNKHEQSTDSRMVIVVDLYNGKYNYNRHYAFGSVDVEKFAEFEKDSCSKQHLDYAKARPSCVSCGIKNDSSCLDSCTCSICTGCYDMLHGLPTHARCESDEDEVCLSQVKDPSDYI